MDIESEINKCIEVLRRGGTILYPTDTIWGIGCDATNSLAVEKIFQIKKRSESKSLIILVADEKMLGKYVKEIPSVAMEINILSNNPVTIIYDDVFGISIKVLAGDGSAGIRIARDEFCKKLISRFRRPLVSTSANLSGGKVPGSFREIEFEIVKAVDYAVNLRRNENSLTAVSSVIKIKPNGEIKIIRK